LKRLFFLISAPINRLAAESKLKRALLILVIHIIMNVK